MTQKRLCVLHDDGSLTVLRAGATMVDAAFEYDEGGRITEATWTTIVKPLSQGALCWRLFADLTAAFVAVRILQKIVEQALS